MSNGIDADSAKTYRGSNTAGLTPGGAPSVGMDSQLKRAVADLFGGVLTYHVWATLGWQDIKQRYRRSVLGPFWLTISTGVMVAGIGLLYARIFNQETKDYIPYLAIGLVVWNFLAALINESCTAFIAADQIIKQVKLPLTIHVSRVIWRNVIMFAHNAVILLIVELIYRKGSLLSVVLVLPGLLLILLNGLWVCLLLGVLCARFRDIPQIITNLVQVTFFMTPIMWQFGLLGSRSYLAEWNPFFHAIELVRAPLLSAGYPVSSLVFLCLMFAFGFPLSLALFTRFRARVAYWV